MRTRLVVSILVWMAASAALADSATAQLSGAATLDAAGVGSGLPFVRGAGAIGANPAALAIETGYRWSMAVLPVVLSREASPLRWGDVTRWRGLRIPPDEKESWIERVALAGSQRGRADAEVTAVAAQRGNFGLQVSSRATAQTHFSEGAAELLLFGNAGRTGEPAEFDLAGTWVDAEALTTVGVGWGRAVHRGQWRGAGSLLTLGVSLTWVEGHLLLTGGDDGSEVRTEPPEVDLSFPVLESASGLAGRGVGLTLGSLWVVGPVTLGFVVHDLYHGFRWNEGAFQFREMELLLTSAGLEMETEARPLEEAPDALKASLRARRLPVRTHLAGAVEFNPTVALSAEVARGAAGDLAGSPTHRVSLGLRLTPPNGRFQLHSGVAVTGNGLRLGGGGQVILGPTALSGALFGGSGSGGQGLGAALGFELRRR